MKTAKARLLLYDLECPHCSELIDSPEENGRISWSIYEPASKTLQCGYCGVVCKVPKRVMSEQIQIDTNWDLLKKG
jgi:hypothetical protein